MQFFMALAYGLAWLVILALPFSVVPLLAIAWHRRRGGRGILAGGVICFAAYVLFTDAVSPRPDPFSFGLLGDVVVFATAGAFYGLITGLTTWAFAVAVRIVGKARRTGPQA